MALGLVLPRLLGVGKLANILTVGCKLYDFHNLRTNQYVSLRLGLSSVVPHAILLVRSITRLKDLVLQNNSANRVINVKDTEGQDQNMKNPEI